MKFLLANNKRTSMYMPNFKNRIVNKKGMLLKQRKTQSTQS